MPNHIALVSGGTYGIRNDCTTCVVDARNLSDTLMSAGKTWKVYAESIPQAGFTGAYAGRYTKKHVGLLHFRDVLTDPVRRADVVPYADLARDLRGDALPDFALVVPDLCHSMHDCSIAVGDRWLRRAVAPLLGLPDTAIFVIFDEGLTDARGGGHVPALVLGTAVRLGSRYTRVTGHYGLLRTIEAAWGLPLLGHSATAAPITGIWR